jgi:hypothetical protein
MDRGAPLRDVTNNQDVRCGRGMKRPAEGMRSRYPSCLFAINHGYFLLRQGFYSCYWVCCFYIIKVRELKTFLTQGETYPPLTEDPPNSSDLSQKQKFHCPLQRKQKRSCFLKCFCPKHLEGHVSLIS